MNYEMTARAVLVGILLAIFAIAVMWSGTAKGHDATHANAEWYTSQMLTQATRERLRVGYTSCCAKSDHYETRFRIVDDGSKYGADGYEYWHKGEQRWRPIHPDIVQRKKTPDGRPVLFMIAGVEVCFVVDEEGI